MPWSRAAMVVLDAETRIIDADTAALELLGVGSLDELRGRPASIFAALPPDPDGDEAFRRAYYASRADGVLAELPFRRLDGELARARIAFIDEGDGRFRVFFYVTERPTTDVTARIYRIADVLSEWRSAERELVDLDPDSDEARRVMEHVELLREQYHVLFDEKRRRDG